MTDQCAMVNDVDERWMRRALELGYQGVGLTSPNPAVGAVIVEGDSVLGEGYHRGAGLAHAEVEALADARRNGHSDLGTATIYVTLEPCSTTGRTGACCSALIEAGVGSVVYGSVDPNPDHVGAADALLGAAGIAVRSRVLEEGCDHLIRDFRKVIQTGLPYVVAKAGMTLDGKLTLPEGEGQWITSEASRLDAMELRFQSDAILVGGATARIDNPHLTLRGEFAKRGKVQPLRIVLSRTGEFDSGLNLFSDQYVDRTQTLVGELDPFMVLKNLGSQGMMRVLLEGGGDIHGRFFSAGMVDELVFYVAPRIGFEGVSVSGALSGVGSKAWRFGDVCRVGDDLRITAYRGGEY